jgi:hypothetical protein
MHQSPLVFVQLTNHEDSKRQEVTRNDQIQEVTDKGI